MRGQISLDLMMAVLATIIILGTFAFLANDIQDNYREMYVQNQLKKISSELSAFVTSTNALEDAKFSSVVEVPVVYFRDRSQKPGIVIDNDQNFMVVSVQLLEKTIQEKDYFSRPPGSIVGYDYESGELRVEK